MARILVIDDDAMIRLLLKEMLEEAGHEVQAASNGTKGIECFQQQPADIVITDLIMPQKEGLSTITELKSKFPHVKIIAISGDPIKGEKNDLEKAKKLGAISTFHKPLRGKILLKAVEQIIGSKIASYQKNFPNLPDFGKILFIGESSRHTEALCKMLSDTKRTWVQAHSHEEALDMVQKNPFAVALLVASDNKAKDLQFAQILIQQECPPFLFFISEPEETPFLEEVYRSGFVDVLFCPISEEILTTKIDIFIELYQQKWLMFEQTEKLKNSLQAQQIISDNLIQSTKELKQSKQQLEIVYSELERITGIFQLFVPKPFLNRIETRNTFQAGQFESENFSIMFSDIRGYTQHSEQMTPSENFEFLNEFFSLMEPSIIKNGGFVDKFIGDGIMALFDQSNSADHALQAAIQMQKSVQEFSQQRQQKGLPEIRIGIGINTGAAMVGAVGSANRLNSTVIGDQVNLSARLEELTKKFHVQILISEYTYSLLKKDHYQIREIDTVKVRGASKPVIVYEVFNNDPPPVKAVKLQTKEIFSRAISLYKAQYFTEALKMFQQCLEVYQDILFFEYVKRCNYFQKHPPQDPSWDSTIAETDLLIEHTRRRRVPRYEAYTDTEILITNTRLKLHHLEGLVVDISIHGMKLEVAKHFEVGTILFVEILLPFKTQDSDSTWFKLLAQVKWVYSEVANDHNSLQKLGLEIIEIPSEQVITFQQALSVYCQEDHLLQ